LYVVINKIVRKLKELAKGLDVTKGKWKMLWNYKITFQVEKKVSGPRVNVVCIKVLSH